MNTTKQTNPETIEISIVIPVYNERENLVLLDQEITKSIKPLNKNYEVILVDDGSTDGSSELIRVLQEKNSTIRLIRFGHNHGQTAAFAAGFDKARGDIIITMDADLQNSPSDIPLLLTAIKDYDVVCGWRHKRNDPWIKIISSKVANKIRSLILNDQCRDTGCSLKIFDKDVFLTFPFFDGIHRFLPALYKGFGKKTYFIDVDHRPRVYGISKYGTFDRMFRGVRDLIKVAKIIKKFKSNRD